MSDVEKICCYDRDNNDALIAALANSKNNDPMTAAAMMNGGLGGQWNNPLHLSCVDDVCTAYVGQWIW